MKQPARIARNAALLRAVIPFTLSLACATGETEETRGLSFGASQTVPGPTVPPEMMTEAMGSDGATDEPTTRPGLTEVPILMTEPDATDTGSEDSGETDDTTDGPVVLCGNGAIDAPEECDGADLDGMDCVSQGFAGGTLACTAQCIFDKIGCTSPSCGDGVVDAGEECDCGQQGGPCTAAQLGENACNTLASPNGGPYSAGELACNSPTSCSFNRAACVYCGDGVKNAAEVCDAADLGGATCQSQGFAGGGLGCTPECGYDTAACTNCGNGLIDAGEACDGGNLNGQTCASINPNVYAGGNLACSAGCDALAQEGCTSGNCCTAGGGAAACSVTPIRECVCSMDAYCCGTNWDQACVNRAINICGADCT